LHSAALSVARKALRMDEDYAKAHYIKALSYEMQDKNEDAKVEYLEYLKSKPSLKEPPVIKSCHAMTKLDPENKKWVVRFAKVAAAIQDDVSLKLAVDTARNRGMKEVSQLEIMLKKLKRKLGTDTTEPRMKRPEKKKKKAETPKKEEPPAVEAEPEPEVEEPEEVPVQKQPEPEIEEEEEAEDIKPEIEEPEPEEPEPKKKPPIRKPARSRKKKKEPEPEPEEEETIEEMQDSDEIEAIPSTAPLDEVEFLESDFLEPEDGEEGHETETLVSAPKRKRIGEYFIAEGLLEAADVLRALEIQKTSDPERKLGDILVSMNLVSARQLQEALSLQVEDMRKNLDRSRGDGLGYVELGNLLLEVGDFYGAIDSYLRACTIYRANEREYMVFELLEGVLDICPESLSAAKEIVRIRKAMDKEGQARAFYRLAVAYLLNDSPHEALASLEEAVSVDPGFEMARTLMDGIRPGLADSDNYADIAMILADIDRKFDKNSAKALASIIKEFQEGIDTAISIDDYNTHYDLGIAYMEMGLYREALSEFEQVLKSPDYRMKAREMLGRCCLRLERFDEAEDHFRKGLSTAAGDLKSSVGFHIAIADVYRATGRTSQADKEIAAASKLDPDMVKVQSSLE
ncbi:MAG: tetratricopeptide repeat protein, partial [Candidatus Aegiribacteria sp.]|nr:tetratricopeptide repeat protein [Candidatus Aegiribacteria sp.]MBD3295354.1 tetratricopeptide repeat protein [Candidatus Fermentibacteria bacterium]